MTAPLVIRVKEKDNVAIAVHDLPVGTEVCVKMGQATTGDQTVIAKLK